jgi:secondary thiamine-phosphate synthase enzyme
MLRRESWTVATRGRGTYEVTGDVDRFVRQAGVDAGLCHLFLHHTSASLILCENADSSVRRDLERYFARLVPDGDPLFEHTLEGDDDMPAHIRSILTQNALAIPVAGGRLDLGTWQGVFVWEHRAAPHRRRLTATLLAP